MYHLPALITALEFGGARRERISSRGGFSQWSGGAEEEFDCVCILGRMWRGDYFVG
jgi:hypothetical protein